MRTYLDDSALLSGVVAFALSVILAFLVREVAIRRSLLDIPNARSSHSVPVPRLGGVAIVCATLGGVTIATSEWTRVLVVLGGAALLLAFTGLVDDLYSVGPMKKYTTQLIAAVLATVVLKPEFELRFLSLDVKLYPILGWILAVLWITAVINAFNFIDGIDGISSSIGVVVTIGILAHGSGALLAVLVPLCAALLGFLVWNMAPASIFMGDSGSQFVGFVLAIGLFLPKDQTVDMLLLLTIFSPILFDTGFTLLRRAVDGKNVIASHNDHLYQRLVRSGVSHRTVAAVYSLLSAFSVVCSIAYENAGEIGKLLIPATLLGVFVGFVFIVTLMDKGVFLLSTKTKHEMPR